MVKLAEQKKATEDKPIEKLTAPAKLYIPLSQHLGKTCIPLVKTGDQVSMGQKIAAVEAKVFAPVHSPVSGRVSSIQDWPHPALGKCRAIVIDNDGLDRPFIAQHPLYEDASKLTAQDIRKIIFESGIVGMGGAAFPTHLKLSPPKPVNTLIINGAECEPYLTGDYRLMVEKNAQILRGIELAVKCLEAKSVIIAIEDNKPEAIKAFEYQLSSLSGYQLKILKSDYPQGAEKQLIKNIIGKEVPAGKLPFEVGVCVHNPATVFAIYQAVYFNKPLYERVITVSGSCLSNPKNLLVRVGTLIKELITYCGPLKDEPAKIIIGGPMMGICQYTEDIPVIKSSTGVILIPKEELNLKEELFCIRCGACVRACPMRLMPTLISLYSQKSLWQEAKIFGAADCIECGLCSYVCPANINLVQSIKRAKVELSR